LRKVGSRILAKVEGERKGKTGETPMKKTKGDRTEKV